MQVDSLTSYTMDAGKIRAMAGRTLFRVLEETATRLGDTVALHQPLPGKQESGYRTYTWAEWAQIAREIALGLQTLGLKGGDVVCVLSETRAEFYLVDLGIMAGGGVSAALYTAYPMPDLAKNIRTAQPSFLMIESAKALESLAKVVEENGDLLPPHIFLMTGELDEGSSRASALRALSQSTVSTLDDLCARGRACLAEDPAAFEKVHDNTSPEDSAILYLTSGATGEPKMSLTSHAAVIANIDMGPQVLPLNPDDTTVVFLPSAHIAQRIVAEFVPIRMGSPVWFSESLARMPTELKTIRPTFFLAPPRVWERMYATVCTEVRKRPKIAQRIFWGALGVGIEAAHRRELGKPVPPWMSALLKAADKAVFSKVRERLGGRIRIAASGAAPLGKDLADFYAAIGMPLIEGYGLTEAGILCFNPLDRPKAGSIGVLLPGVEARLREDGELQVKTPCIFQGYYRDEAATRSVMSDDGWFSTGDIAEVDKDGYWYIIGRKKELIVSSNGKKIYPSRIENLFKMEPLVSQILLIGDKQPYITALMTVNAAQAQTVDGGEALKGLPLDQLVQSEPVTVAVQNAVARVNKQLADFERIRRFKVLGREFSIEDGEVTATQKIRRTKVLENHRELVNALYLGREESS